MVGLEFEFQILQLNWFFFIIILIQQRTQLKCYLLTESSVNIQSIKVLLLSSKSRLLSYALSPPYIIQDSSKCQISSPLGSEIQLSSDLSQGSEDPLLCFGKESLT